MSFTFNWPRFSDQFHYDAIQMLNNALNKGNKPPVIADKIEVVELEMGTEPPELEIREIGELTVDQFRGIFRLSYAGDAYLVLKTKVQANPLNHKQPDIHLMTGTKGMLAARQPLVVPMLLRLSQFKLRSIIVLVVSKQKGITLVFKTDPLQNVDINSTFDSIAVIQKFIQREIEGQLRQMFREDLPGIIHRLSQQWIKAKVEAPYLSKRPSAPPNSASSIYSSSIPPDPLPAPLSFHNVAGVPTVDTPPFFRGPPSSSPAGLRRPRSAHSGASGTSTRRTAAAVPPTTPIASPPPPDTSTSTFPDLENYDPTYGLRPEGLPTKSVFKGFKSLFTPNRGLVDLAEEVSEADGEVGLYDYDDTDTYDMVDWDDGVPSFGASSSEMNPPEGSVDRGVEYETIPAVGGGTIIRPRVLHSQSMIQTSSDVTPAARLSSSSRMSASYDSILSPTHPGIVRSATFSGSMRQGYNPYFAESVTGLTTAGLSFRTPSIYLDTPTTPQTAPVFISQPNANSIRRPVTPDSLETQQSYSSGDHTQPLLTPQEGEPVPIPPTHRTSNSRRPSISSNIDNSNNLLSTSPSNYSITGHDLEDGSPRIVLRPSPFNNTLHQLSTLSHSNHTLSPYTRSLEHFTVRSGPPRYTGSPLGFPTSPPKAKRKRTYHLGGQKSKVVPPEETLAEINTTGSTDNPPHPDFSYSPSTRSEFDIDDMDRYFRANDVNDPKQLQPQPNLSGVNPHNSPNIHPNHFRLRSSYIHPE